MNKSKLNLSLNVEDKKDFKIEALEKGISASDYLILCWKVFKKVEFLESKEELIKLKEFITDNVMFI